MAVPTFSGVRYANLEAVEPDPSHRKKWLFRCVCGNIKSIQEYHVRHGLTRSCGCLRGSLISQAKDGHGKTGTPLYKAYLGIRARCASNSHDRRNYHDRGIGLSPEWSSFVVFETWSLNNGYKPGLTIDRINNYKGYGPDNCRWVTGKANNQNRRDGVRINVNGKYFSVQEMSAKEGVCASTIKKRYAKSLVKLGDLQRGEL